MELQCCRQAFFKADNTATANALRIRPQNKQAAWLIFQEVKMPDSMSSEVASFLTGLLTKNPEKRLGCTGRGWVLRDGAVACDCAL